MTQRACGKCSCHGAPGQRQLGVLEAPGLAAIVLLRAERCANDGAQVLDDGMPGWRRQPLHAQGIEPGPDEGFPSAPARAGSRSRRSRVCSPGRPAPCAPARARTRPSNPVTIEVPDRGRPVTRTGASKRPPEDHAGRSLASLEQWSAFRLAHSPLIHRCRLGRPAPLRRKGLRRFATGDPSRSSACVPGAMSLRNAIAWPRSIEPSAEEQEATRRMPSTVRNCRQRAWRRCDSSSQPVWRAYDRRSISSGHTIVFTHVPKTGGTTLDHIMHAGRHVARKRVRRLTFPQEGVPPRHARSQQFLSLDTCRTSSCPTATTCPVIFRSGSIID